MQNLYFNRDLFARQGLKTPEQHEKEGTWTWETYLDLARRLTTGSRGDKVFGAVWRAANLDILLGTIWPFGGDLWDKAMTRTLLDSRRRWSGAVHRRPALPLRRLPHGRRVDAVHRRPPTPGGAFSAGRCALEIQPNDSLAPHIIPATFQKGWRRCPRGGPGASCAGWRWGCT